MGSSLSHSKNQRPQRQKQISRFTTGIVNQTDKSEIVTEQKASLWVDISYFRWAVQ